ncbi:hypothetical protein [Rathayibacter sp. AY1D2]|uniref:hypothetical protein n=1 Tax=Rathayibacter sp. AY1D2 TaxID=2080543 RepID=UPI0011B082A9|nr:hypothetical protein [Rathayibacter sp. AY1D2]
MVLLDAVDGGSRTVRAVLPVDRLEEDSALADSAKLLLLARSGSAPAGFLSAVEKLVTVLASAESSIQLRTLGTRDRTVVYGIGPEWTADIVFLAEGECTIGLLPTASVPSALRTEHLVFNASLDLTLLVRGAAGPVDLVFADGVLANGRGELIALRGSGVAPNEFGDLLESALAGYLTTASLAGSEA